MLAEEAPKLARAARSVFASLHGDNPCMTNSSTLSAIDVGGPWRNCNRTLVRFFPSGASGKSRIPVSSLHAISLRMSPALALTVQCFDIVHQSGNCHVGGGVAPGSTARIRALVSDPAVQRLDPTEHETPSKNLTASMPHRCFGCWSRADDGSVGLGNGAECL